MEVKQMDPDAGSGWTYWMTEKLSEQKILLPSNYSTLLEKRRDSRMLLNSIRQGYFKNLDTKSLVCHIEAVKENKIKNATAELSKYMSKPLTKMAKELEEAEYCVYWIDQAFHRQRTTAFWGEAWEVQKNLNKKDKEESADGEVADLIIKTYVWEDANGYKQIFLK